MIDDTLGDGPIEDGYMVQMTTIARALDELFNGKDAKVGERKTGFVLLVFPFNNHEGRCNYISNGANRQDIAVLLREQLARFEGMPAPKGHA